MDTVEGTGDTGADKGATPPPSESSDNPRTPPERASEGECGENGEEGEEEEEEEEDKNRPEPSLSSLATRLMESGRGAFYDPGPTNTFHVRGKMYMHDKHKVPAGPAVGQLVFGVRPSTFNPPCNVT